MGQLDSNPDLCDPECSCRTEINDMTMMKKKAVMEMMTVMNKKTSMITSQKSKPFSK